MEHSFRPRTPLWTWFVVAGCVAIDLALGYAIGWRVALPGVLIAGSFVALRPRSVRLERDESGAAHLVAGGSDPPTVDLSRLVEVKFMGSGYGMRDQDGGQLIVPLDSRLRNEVTEAAGRHRLELDADTDAALASGYLGRPPLRQLSALAVASVALPAVIVGMMVVVGGGIELDRDNAVHMSDVLAANETYRATGNPFINQSPRELYLIGLDEESQKRLPDLKMMLFYRFGMQSAPTAPMLLDGGLLDTSRDQIDAWQLTSRLIAAHQDAHPGRPAILVGVTALDTFTSAHRDFRFAYLTSGSSSSKAVCAGVISTARFDFWPGSEEERLGKMAGRLLGRCLGIQERVSIQSIADVDRLDARAGADPAAIAQRVAWRRALPGAPIP